ncbi:MAG: hypothetical protein JWN53_2257 [Gemmatimonadetes bacterium]|jgi:uncharacterized repeat protein (TIGR01451 family)|nr:hypothetical protein [Gemmatimonadota bacterium]
MPSHRPAVRRLALAPVGASRAVRAWVRGAVLAAGVLLLPARVEAQAFADTTLFSLDGTTALYTVNRLTGATTKVATLLFASNGLARDPISGRLYYTASGAPTGRVAYWDPITNGNTLLNSTGKNDKGVNDVVTRLGFSQTGVLYGIGNGGALYSIDRLTGAYTTIGTVKIGTTAGATIGLRGDLAFDYDATPYLASLDASGNMSLFRLALTPTAGVNVATFIGTAGVIQTQAMAFGADGRLYTGTSSRRIYSVSKTGAGATLLATNAVYQEFASSPRFADLSGTVTTPGLPAGASTTYTITVSNGGPQSANGQVTLRDSLPAGITYQSVSGAGWTCGAVGQLVTCTNPGPIASGGTSSLVLTVAVAAGASGTLTNIVNVLGSTIDQTQANNRFTVSAPVVANVTFSLVKRHAGSFSVGVNGVYTVVAHNTGTSSTTSALTLTDTMPAGMSYVSGTGTGWVCGAVAGPPQIVTCTHANTTPVAAGDSTIVTLTLGIAAAAVPAQTNKAYLGGGGQFAPIFATDPTTVTTTGTTVTPDGAAVTQLPSNGTSYTQNFLVTNSGSGTDVYTLTASVVPVTVLSVVSVNGTAGASGSVSIASGATATVPVVYSVATAALAGATDTLKLLATSQSNPASKDPGTIIVTVIRAGLTIAKQLYRDDRTTLIAPGAQVSPGEFVQFKVTVTATGTAVSTLVHVTDLVPAAVTYVSTNGDGSGWTFAQAAGTVTADLGGTLGSGSSRYFWVRVQVQ